MQVVGGVLCGALAVALGLGGCSSHEHPATLSDELPSRGDAGSRADASADADAETSATSDSGKPREAGLPPDASRRADATVARDATAARDATVARDAHPDHADAPDARPSLPEASADARPLPWFTEVAKSAGLTYVQTRAGGCTMVGGINDCESSHMSGGAAAGDLDGDGRVDLVVTRLDGPALAYMNQGDGTFVAAGTGAGLALAIGTNGAGLADIDNDGDLDLYLTRQGAASHFLYINDGKAHFTEEGTARGASLQTGAVLSGTSVSFGDFDRDGFIDMHVNEWLPVTQSPYLPAIRLLHNLGAASPGHFEDVTAKAGVQIQPNGVNGAYAFASSFADFDDDGWPDLAITADFGTSKLFWNKGDGTFLDGTTAAKVGTDQNGMGAAIGDVDGDGRLDWFVTSIYDPANTCLFSGCNWKTTGNRMYRNLGARVFTDVTDTVHVRDTGWGWGATLFDADNDGDLDLAAASGVRFPEGTTEDLFNDGPVRFWRFDGGVGTEMAATAGLVDRASSKAIVAFDYDADGDVDLFIVNNQGTPMLFRNELGNQSAFLRVRLVGTASSREAFGARVTVRVGASDAPMVRELTGGSSYLSADEPVVHFGLGPGTTRVAEVRVRWPRTGTEQVLTDVAAGQTLTITEQ